MSSLFGVYDDLSSGGDNTQHSAMDPLTPADLFGNIDGTSWFDRNFKMDTDPLSDSMILDAMKPITDTMSSGTAAMPKRPSDHSDNGVQYEQLQNLQHQPMHSVNGGHDGYQQQREDDGYGSQTAVHVAG